jgi:peptidoglycan/xylan/chitin deacetylase (PgdA/CDA1 family)
MTALVLAYHSHNISGSDYATNDHVALASDLETLTGAGARIVPAEHIAEVVRSGAVGGDGQVEVAITFDDGPVFDFADFVHPRFGAQRGFINIFRDFHARHPGAQPALQGTSFVIASPGARAAMERAESCGYTFLSDWLTHDWWAAAADSGLLAIGNHSWDHVHHAVDEIATTRGVRDNFEAVDNYADADREIREAGAYINSHVGGRCRVFAFPFGHVNGYLVNDYLPQRRQEHGMVAAFGTCGRPVRPGDSVWNIPRAVCGYHWKSPAELVTLLGS